MKKKLISTVLAAVTAFSTVSAFNTSATARITAQELIDENFTDKIKVEDFMWLYEDYGKQFADNYQGYIDYDNGYVNFYLVSPESDIISLEFYGSEYFSELEKIVADIDEDLKLIKSNTHTSDGVYSCEIRCTDIDNETAKKIREAVGNKAINFKYQYARVSFKITSFYNITGYPPYPYGTIDYNTNRKKLRNYIEKNNINADIASYSYGETDANGNLVQTLYDEAICVFPLENLTPTEHFELAKNIYEETGLIPEGYSLDINRGVSKGIDLSTYLNGDANCDQKYSIADSTAILQALGNPDKYGLSDLGLFNADSTGNGLTVEDAVAIKTALAKGL